MLKKIPFGPHAAVLPYRLLLRSCPCGIYLLAGDNLLDMVAPSPVRLHVTGAQAHQAFFSIIFQVRELGVDSKLKLAEAMFENHFSATCWYVRQQRQRAAAELVRSPWFELDASVVLVLWSSLVHNA